MTTTRERWARIIDPVAFARHGFSGDPDWHPDDQRRRQSEALAKADALLADLPRLDDGWRPIPESMGAALEPFDGAPVLLICMSAYAPTAFEGWYGWWNGAHGWHHFSLPEPKWAGGVTRWFPTHWMPKPSGPALPAPPHQEGGE